MADTNTYEPLKWPQGKKCAVMLSFDVDGDTIWKNGSRDFENGDKFIRANSVGNYGPKRAVEKILNLLDKHDIKASFFIPAKVMEDYPLVAQEINNRGHEIGHHGYHHERYVDLSPEEQTSIINKSQKIFEEVIGKKAIGYRTPSGDWSRETAGILYKMGFQYSSSMRGDDRPYRTVIEGEVTDFIELSPKWDLDDFVQFGYNLFPAEPSGQDRIAGIEQVYDNFTKEFDGYYAEGLCFVIQCHPQIIGSPGRLLMYERIIEHIKNFDGVWFAKGSDIADWWRNNY
ncbi:MAG: polysaccharide deacetylase [Lachnospiraceae bacterium]|nr:polysaccharide deacetylase [Lachnospiraceae bacterium]